jgi:hypothetical protein
MRMIIIIITLQFDIITMGASCVMNLGKEKGRDSS